MNYVTLHHGTDELSAIRILNDGLDAALAARYNAGGEFWATTNAVLAEWFAKTNPAIGVPARLDFELPEQVLQQLLTHSPALALAHTGSDYEFFPPGFNILNQYMTNKRVVLLP